MGSYCSGVKATIGLALAATLACCGCTEPALTHSTARTAGTAMEIVYQMVMDNMARLADEPSRLPSQIRIRQGTVQVSDEVGLRELGVQWGGSPGFSGPRAVRSVSEQWGADAITDPVAVKQLQNVYRAALGHPPLKDPGFMETQLPESSSLKQPTSGPSITGVLNLDRDVPTGWFHKGRAIDVPPGAVYVGHYRGTWVWVMPEGVEGLSRFTLTVLFVAKAKPSDATEGAAGLMYTPGS